MTVKSTIHISKLSKIQQAEIANLVFDTLDEAGDHDEQEINELVSDAIESRLSDLADTIDIHELQHTEIDE